MTVCGIVIAAGRGQRFGGDVPKQFLRLARRRVLDWSLDTVRRCCDSVVLVVSADWYRGQEDEADAVVIGGGERSESVRRGLAAAPQESEIILVHDGVRPLASRQLFDAVIAAVRGGADGAIPGVPIIDTIKSIDGRVVRETLDRSQLVAVQTPQAFEASILRHAYRTRDRGTDDASLVERAGGQILVVEGETNNIKITYPGDIERAELVLAARGRVASRPRGPSVA